METRKMAEKSIEFRPGTSPLQKFEENGRGHSGPILLKKRGDPIPNLRNHPGREIKEPRRGIDKDEAHALLADSRKPCGGQIQAKAVELSDERAPLNLCQKGAQAAL